MAFRIWPRVAMLALMLWLATPLAAQTVYRVVDEQGRVTFTDNPDQGGEAVELAPLQSVSASPAASSRTRPSARPSSPGQPFMPYDRFEIAYPRPEARVDTTTQVEVAVSPALREDHQMRLRLNGEVSQTALHSDAFWLANLPAGVHQLQAELLDAQGRVRHQTSSVRIHVAP
ncbi:DUF4124 domain-containing protein [Halomonas sp. LS-001]